MVAILSVFSIIGFYYNFRLFKNEFDKYGEYDYAYLFVLIVIGLEALQNTLHFFHLIIYNSNGKGIGAFVVLSEII
jgi:predicted tellurium resistance membrane protein TerC